MCVHVMLMGVYKYVHVCNTNLCDCVYNIMCLHVMLSIYVHVLVMFVYIHVILMVVYVYNYNTNGCMCTCNTNEYMWTTGI